MSSDRTIAAEMNRGLDYRTLAAWTVFLAALATIAGAWAFELIGNYIPCALCLAPVAGTSCPVFVRFLTWPLPCVR